MRRSEWVKNTVASLSKPGAWFTLPTGMCLSDLPRGITDAEETAEAMARWMDTKPGFVKWDPEEPKGLPASIVVIEVRGGLLDPPHPFLVPRGRAIESKEEQLAIYAAAVEAYNRIEIMGGREAVTVIRDEDLGTLHRRLAAALTEVRSAVPSFERIEAILEGGDPDHAAPSRQYDPVTIPREVVVAYESLRKFVFGSGV